MSRNLIFPFFLLIAFSLQAQGLYDIERVVEVRLTIDKKDWDQCLDSLKELGNDDRIIGKAVVDGVVYDSVGIRYKGNSSYFNVRNAESSKLPFNIKADYIKRKQNFADKNEKYESLKLSNIFRDPSFIREVLAYEIARKYMPAPRANFVNLYINDNYLGLYNNSESVDKELLKNHFDYKKGILFKCDPIWHASETSECPKGDHSSLMYLGEDSTCYFQYYEIKTDYGWKELIELTRTLNKDIENIEKVLNVDQVLWMHAFNNVIVNLDSYTGRLCHNYYLYRDTYGIFHPIVWDMNMAFGGFQYDGTGPALSRENLIELSPFVHYKDQNEKRPLITNLLKVDLYRKIYIAHIKTILEENFISKEYLKRAETIRKMILPLVEQDSNKLYSLTGFKENLDSTSSVGTTKIIGIAELMEARTEYLSNHPLFSRQAPVISAVKHDCQEKSNVISAKVEHAEKVYLAYRTNKYTPFKRIEMTDDGLTGDDILDDSIYSVRIDNCSGTEYYIIAEGDKNAALSPARASFEYHVIE